MSVTLKSSDVQQNFGRVIDQALLQDDVIVERYGEPRVVIVGYRRYQQLLEAEQSLRNPCLQEPNRSDEARQQGQIMAEEIRRSLALGDMEDKLEEAMKSLRGRLWS